MDDRDQILDALLDDTSRQSISRGEQEALRRALREPGSYDPYELLSMVARFRASELEDEVQRFLAAPEDPGVAAKALQVLTIDLNKAPAYRDFVLAFGSGVDWDDEDDVRLIALSVAGEMYRRNPDPDLLAVLITAATAAERPLIRDVALEALARALGAQWSELTSDQSPIDRSDVLEQARVELERVKAN
jgi:hypothetical protein